MQASAAAARAMALLAKARGSRVRTKAYPPERDVSDEPPRIGVFVCHCGSNIASVVDVERVVAADAAACPAWSWPRRNVYTCADDNQDQMKAKIAEHRLNRVVVASCTPRTHEPIFRDTLRDAGLNPYLLEMANIRDQCSWVHSGNPDAATEKAIDLVRMATARAAALVPLQEATAPVNNAALVVGGGIAGMTAALALAEQGFPVHLVEKSDRLGGTIRQIHRTLDGHDVQALLAETIEPRRRPIRGSPSTCSRAWPRSAGTWANSHPVAQIRQRHRVRKATTARSITAWSSWPPAPRSRNPARSAMARATRVLTQLELSDRLGRGKISLPKQATVAMIQCVEQRDAQRPYCSRVCCTTAVKNALELKRRWPDARIVVLYRDMRTYGFREAAYREAREKGVLFIRYEPEQPPQLLDSRRETAAEGAGAVAGPRPGAGAGPRGPGRAGGAAGRSRRVVRTVAGAAERRRLLPRSAHEAPPGRFRQRGLVPLRIGPRAEVHQRNDLPGHRGGGPGGVDPLAEEDAGGRPDRLGRSGQVHLLHDLRPRLPLHGPAGGREQQGRGAGGRLHGLRKLLGGVPGQGHHAAALHGRPDPGGGEQPAGERKSRTAAPAHLSGRGRRGPADDGTCKPFEP